MDSLCNGEVLPVTDLHTFLREMVIFVFLETVSDFFSSSHDRWEQILYFCSAFLNVKNVNTARLSLAKGMLWTELFITFCDASVDFSSFRTEVGSSGVLMRKSRHSLSSFTQLYWC